MGRRSLSRPEIVTAALRYVDQHGLEALSMRALAKEIGVYPTALYWHIGTKAQLVGAVTATVLDDIVLPADHELRWDEWLVEVARLCRQAMHRHPNLSPVIGSQLVVTTAALPLVERVLNVLERAGFTGRDLVDVYNAVAGFILGWVSLELASGPLDVEDDWQEEYAGQLRSVNPNAYPAMTRNMDLLAGNAFMTRWESGRVRPMDRSFEASLELLILGLRVKQERV
ncbi:AcrR family transcriptional regulator [Kibdelosporangium banguiense]|uniref:AcrR family transcriptional regulator n=1 Tax=Kibdelosporangium banguiense TaxID=1365924 RepID=A0ABS4TJC0_9PSEU|nr:TetR/AcrR family transcriptional regulator C-terminal domain-containing protein [Kibdelosporangium banguiense]MBP2324419.1 AcrR family transcriptional regulator [Kibdelosporangium banguiense]